MKILVIGLDYHEYTAAIVNELRAKQYSVKFYSIQPRTLLYKAAKVISQKLWFGLLSKYHDRLLKVECENKYDLVLFIQVHQFSQVNLTRLRECQASARFILYNWDSISNHDYRPYLWAFDKVASFDPRDSANFGVEYLPLFALRRFQDVPCVQEGGVYFVGNIGNVARYDAVKAFEKYCAGAGVIFHHYMVCSPVVALRILLSGKLPRGIHFRSISATTLAEMMSVSSAVFDFANHKQSGCTMRTIENLCAGKKIITQNTYINDEAFFSADRILVFVGYDFCHVKKFLKIPIVKPEERFAEYHIQNFVANLLMDKT